MVEELEVFRSKTEVALTPDGEVHLADLLSAVNIDLTDRKIGNFKEKVADLCLAMKALGEIKLPVVSRITPGLYSRESSADAGVLLISAIHLKDHQFIMSSGSCLVITENGITRADAPFHGITKAGTQRVVFILSPTTWTTFHATSLTNIEEIEKELFDFSTPKLDPLIEIRLSPEHEDFLKMASDVGVTPDEIEHQSHNGTPVLNLPEKYLDAVACSSSQIEGIGIFAMLPFSPEQVIAPAAMEGFRTICGRFTNHSHAPNAKMQSIGGGSVDLVALRHISPWEEITVDYRQARAAAIESSLTYKPKITNN